MKINLYKNINVNSNIFQMPAKRDWMDETFDRHAYNCFPMNLANRLGWGISFNKDVKFILKSDSLKKEVTILDGQDICSANRLNRTVSFNTGLIFSPENNISLLTIPPPNIFIEGVQCITTIISTSAIIGDLPIALMVTSLDKEIIIKANTPIATVFPINIKDLNKLELNIIDDIPNFMKTDSWNSHIRERGEISQKLNSNGKWTNFYKNAIDHLGEPLGEHEAINIRMDVNNGKN